MPRSGGRRNARDALARQVYDTARVLEGVQERRLVDEPPQPMLCTLVDRPPHGDQWLHEIKWDGYRLLAVKIDGAVRLWSRNALEWTSRLPMIAKAVEDLPAHTLALDGELIAGGGTKADFAKLQAVLSGKDRKTPLSFVLFDLLHLEDLDLTPAPLMDRKVLLRALLSRAQGVLGYSNHVAGGGIAAFEAAGNNGFEGVISKRAQSSYRPGRNDDWRKVKHLAVEQLAMVGYLPATGASKGVGSLLLARWHGGRWCYAGKAGSGLTDAWRREILAMLQGRAASGPTASIPDRKQGALRDAVWCEPMFIVEVFHRGADGQEILRQPSIKAVHLDASPSMLVR